MELTPTKQPEVNGSSATPSSPVTLKEATITVAGHPISTHTIAIVLGAVLACLGPIISERFPQAAPAIEAAKQVLPKTDPPSPVTSMSAYESQIRAAWANEKEDSTLKKAEKISRLIFLYRYMAFAVESKTTLVADSSVEDLYKAVRDESEKLGMTNQLPIIRGAILAEWNVRIPDAKGPLTEPLRSKMSSFIHETVGLLEKLI